MIYLSSPSETEPLAFFFLSDQKHKPGIWPATTWSNKVWQGCREHESDRKSPPGVEHGSVLEVALLVHQQHVSVLGLAAAEEGPMQHLHIHLGLRQLPGGGGGQQRREEAAERGHQHAAAPLPALVGEASAGTVEASAGQQPTACARVLRGNFHQRLRNPSDWLPSCSQAPPTDGTLLPFVHNPPTYFIACLEHITFMHEVFVKVSSMHLIKARKERPITSCLGVALTWQTATQVHMQQHLNFINTVNLQ